MSNQLAKQDDDNELDIAVLIESLAQQLDNIDLPDKVIKATELLVAGYPTYQVARKIGVSTTTVRSWLSKYPTMAMIISNSKTLMTKIRMQKLEQQFMDAVERSEEILALSLDGSTELGSVDSKVLAVVALQARYIIGLFAGQKSDVVVTHEVGDSILQAREDALRYIADQINNDNVIDAVVRIVDPKKDTEGPLVDEYGNPPFGAYGEVETTDRGVKCAICGGSYKAFAKHISSKHDMSSHEYEITYSLPDGIIRQYDLEAKRSRKKTNGTDSTTD